MGAAAASWGIGAPFDVSALQSHLSATLLMYCTTARLAAENRSDAQVEQLQRMLQEHQAGMRSADMNTIVTNNRAFHLAVAEAGGNALFTAWTAAVLDGGQRLMGMYVRETGATRSPADLNDHVAIVQAIARRDPAAAEKAARADAMVLFDQVQRHLFKDALAGISPGRMLPPKSR